jgi:hypothetical protein
MKVPKLLCPKHIVTIFSLVPLLASDPAVAALIFFPDRASFNAANPNVTSENFETPVAPPGPSGAGVNFSGPLDSTTNNAIFQPGDIADGIRFSTTGVTFDLVLYPATVPFATFPSQVLGTPGAPFILTIEFTAANVFAVGMDLFNVPNLTLVMSSWTFLATAVCWDR